MEAKKIWMDYLDIERIEKTGSFYLHRNYLNEKFEYDYPVRRYSAREFVDEEKVLTEHPQYLDETKPIAQGITAYFAIKYFKNWCLKEYLERKVPFNSLEFYSLYFNFVLSYQIEKNNTLPLPLPTTKVERDFIKSHRMAEIKSLSKSEKYYSEFRDEFEMKLLQNIRSYVTGYLLWLETKEEKNQVFNLKGACVDNESYIFLRSWFVNVGLVERDTFLWKGDKGILASYIKDLHRKKYTVELTEAQIMAIAEGDFNCTMKRRIVTSSGTDKIPPYLPVLPLYRS